MIVYYHICPSWNIFIAVIDNVKLLPAHRHSPSLLNLPNLGDFVLLIITAVISLERVFAQMPFGSNTLTMEGNGMTHSSMIVCQHNYAFVNVSCCMYLN